MIVAINLHSDRTDVEDKAVAELASANGMTYCRVCIDGCHHGTHGGCGHSGCWGPEATNDCAGVEFARQVYKLANA